LSTDKAPTSPFPPAAQQKRSSGHTQKPQKTGENLRIQQEKSKKGPGNPQERRKKGLVGGGRVLEFPRQRLLYLMLESIVGMPRVRVYLSPAAFFAALILLWTVAVYLGFFCAA